MSAEQLRAEEEVIVIGGGETQVVTSVEHELLTGGYVGRPLVGVAAEAHRTAEMPDAALDYLGYAALVSVEPVRPQPAVQ